MSKTVLVTGASDGIGLEIARQAIARGDKVMMVARDKAKLERAAAGMRGAGVAETRVVDLADARALDQFLADLDARGYVPDVLVNNAGQGLSGAFVEAGAARIDEMLRLNILALTRLSHWAARGMKARRGGAIVNLSAAVATRPTPYFAAYAASKAYVTNLSQAMHSELRAHGVTVSAIHPPAVRTSFADASKADLGSTLVLKLFPTVGPGDGRAREPPRRRPRAAVRDRRPCRGHRPHDRRDHAARPRPRVHDPSFQGQARAHGLSNKAKGHRL